MYTKEEAAHQRRVINELLVRLYHPERIVQTMQTNFSVQRTRTLRLIAEELARWDHEEEANPMRRKRAAAEQRLATYLEECRKRFFNTSKDGPKGSMKDLMLVEEQLAKIQGTLAPIKVDINVSISANMAAVLANLTPTQIQAALDRQLALRQAARIASQANLLLPETEAAIKQVIDVEGQAAE